MKTLEFSLQGDFMCGRYTIFTDQQNDEMADILQQVQNQVKTDEIYPTNPAPVILADKVQAFYWGFLKFKSTGVIINARAETVAEKKVFKNSLAKRRCIIPATGFYEWKNKQKYYFIIPNQPVLYMAGIYNEFHKKPHFIILTTAANASVEKIHDRMPLVLEKTMVEDWILNDKNITHILQSVPPQLQSSIETKTISLFT